MGHHMGNFLGDYLCIGQAEEKRNGLPFKFLSYLQSHWPRWIAKKNLDGRVWASLFLGHPVYEYISTSARICLMHIRSLFVVRCRRQYSLENWTAALLLPLCTYALRIARYEPASERRVWFCTRRQGNGKKGRIFSIANSNEDVDSIDKQTCT